MNPMLKRAAKHAVPHLATLTRGRKKRMLVKAGKWAAGRVMHKRARTSMGTLALRGLGVAVLAVPVGMWLGRKMMAGQETGAAD
jgi:hypothetical protein